MAVTQLGFHENLINNWQDALAGAITDSATTITVDDATDLPTVGYFRVKIDSELILCDGRTGNNLSVATGGRGIEGTTAASHLDNAPISAVLTATGLQRFMLDHRATAFQEDSIIRTTPHNRFLDAQNNILTVSDFTWLNQGGATATDLNGSIYMTIPDEANINIRGLLLPIPNVPYRALVKVNMGVGMGTLDNNGTHAGLILRDQVTGKLTTASVRYGGRMAFWNWDDETTFNASVDTNQTSHEAPIWIRIDDDGVNLSMRTSNSGIGFSTTANSSWWQQARTAHMANGPSHIGIYLNSGTNSGNNGAGPAVCHVTFEAFRLEER